MDLHTATPPHPTTRDFEAAARACFGWNQADASDPLFAFVARVMAAQRDWCAKLCDDVARNKRDYGPAERALAKKLAEQMRGGAR